MTNKISREAAKKFLQDQEWKRDNTEVQVSPGVHDNGVEITRLYLHGNEIARKVKGGTGVLMISLSGWPTRTTLSRLNALPGVYLSQRDFQVYQKGEKKVPHGPGESFPIRPTTGELNEVLLSSWT